MLPMAAPPTDAQGLTWLVLFGAFLVLLLVLEGPTDDDSDEGDP